MNFIWRFIWSILFSRFSSPLSLFDEGTISFHVLPTDIDVLMHMNNGRYLSYCDIGRIDHIIRSNIFPIMKRNHIYPVLASEMIRFKKPLRLFHRFEVKTKLIGWDDKFFYFVHHFISKQELHSLCLVKIRMLRKGGGGVSPEEVLALVGYKGEPPLLPSWVANWQLADKTFHDEALKL